MIGIIKSREIKKNKDGEQEKILLQVEISDPDDIQTVELMTTSGDDSNPPDESRVFIVDVGGAYKIAIAVDDLITPSMSPGEKNLYSSENGTIKAFINLLKTGILELNGNTDYAVRYSKLNTAFNQLRNDFNLFLTHVHSGGFGGGATGPATPPFSPSTASIAAAKVEEVKLP